MVTAPWWLRTHTLRMMFSIPLLSLFPLASASCFFPGPGPGARRGFPTRIRMQAWAQNSGRFKHAINILHVAKRSHSKKRADKKINVDQPLPAERPLSMDSPSELRLYRATRIGSRGAGKVLEGGRLGERGLRGGGRLGDRGRWLAAAVLLLALLVTPGESSPATEVALGRNASTAHPPTLGSALSPGLGSVASVAAAAAMGVAASEGGLCGGLAALTGGLTGGGGLIAGIIIGGAITGMVIGKPGPGQGVVGAASSGGSSTIGVTRHPGGGGAIAAAAGRIIPGCQTIPGCNGNRIPLAAGGSIIPGAGPPCPIIIVIGCGAMGCIVGATEFLSSCSSTSNNPLAKYCSARRSPMAPCVLQQVLWF